MKITIEVPDTTMCGFLNYVYIGNSGLEMGTKALDTDRLKEAEKGGADNGKAQNHNSY